MSHDAGGVIPRAEGAVPDPGATPAGGERPSPGTFDPESRLVTVADRLTVPEADLTQAMLRQAGIDSALADVNTVWMNWFWMDALRGIKVQVAARDLAAARELLAQPPWAFPALAPDSEPPRDEVEPPSDGSPPCPDCGARDAEYREGASLGFLVEWFERLVPLPLLHGRWICRECGKRWIEGDPGPV